MLKASSLTYAPNGVEGSSKEDIVTVASGTSQEAVFSQKL